MSYVEEAANHLARRRKIVGQRMREAREAKGLKQKDLARRVNVEPQTVSNWERGVYEPDLDTLDLIARVLGVPASQFLRDAEPTEQVSDAEVLARLDAVEALLQDVLRRLPVPPGEAEEGA